MYLSAVFLYVSIYLSIYESINQWIYESITLWIYESIYLPAYLSIHISIYQCIDVWMYGCIDINVSMCRSIYPSFCLSIYLSICLSVCLSIYLSMRMGTRRNPLSIYPYVKLVNLNSSQGSVTNSIWWRHLLAQDQLLQVPGGKALPWAAAYLPKLWSRETLIRQGVTCILVTVRNYRLTGSQP